jgi:hypothetical protein
MLKLEDEKAFGIIYGVYKALLPQYKHTALSSLVSPGHVCLEL